MVRRVCHFGGWVLEDFALHKGPFLTSKVPYNRVLFCSNLKLHPLKMHVLQTSTAKIFKSLLNHTFWGHFCPPFLEFALQKGQIFGADAPYQRVGFQIPKWHTRVQKSGKSPPPPRDFLVKLLISVNRKSTILNNFVNFLHMLCPWPGLFSCSQGYGLGLPCGNRTKTTEGYSIWDPQGGTGDKK